MALAEQSCITHLGGAPPKAVAVIPRTCCTLETFIWLMATRANGVCMTSRYTMETLLPSEVSWTILTSWAFKSPKLFLTNCYLVCFKLSNLLRCDPEFFQITFSPYLYTMNKYILMHYNIQIHTDLIEFCYRLVGLLNCWKCEGKVSVDKGNAVLLWE